MQLWHAAKREIWRTSFQTFYCHLHARLWNISAAVWWRAGQLSKASVIDSAQTSYFYNEKAQTLGFNWWMFCIVHCVFVLSQQWKRSIQIVRHGNNKRRLRIKRSSFVFLKRYANLHYSPFVSNGIKPWKQTTAMFFSTVNWNTSSLLITISALRKTSWYTSTTIPTSFQWSLARMYFRSKLVNTYLAFCSEYKAILPN